MIFICYYILSCILGFYFIIYERKAWGSLGSWVFVFLCSPILVGITGLLLSGIYIGLCLLWSLGKLDEFRNALS
jgi:hypothetical protein